MDWEWLPAALGSAGLGVVVYFIRRWNGRRGSIHIYVGDRNPPTYITRGSWDAREQRLVQTPPRFMNFSVPLTVENSRDADLTIRIKNVWFSDGRPEIRKDGWKLPGSCLSPTGVVVRDAAGNISDPVRIPANSIEHFIVPGTATSPVCHERPYETWKYVFIDWISTPVKIAPFIQAVSDGRTFESDIKPAFPLPEHYPAVQGGIQE